MEHTFTYIYCVYIQTVPHSLSIYMLMRLWFRWDFVLFLFYCIPLVLPWCCFSNVALCVLSLDMFVACFPCCVPIHFYFPALSLLLDRRMNARIWFVCRAYSEDAVLLYSECCACLFSFSVFDSVGSGAFRSTPSIFISRRHTIRSHAKRRPYFLWFFWFCFKFVFSDQAFSWINEK